MTVHRPPWELARAMDWGPLEQYVPTLTAVTSNPTGHTISGRFRRYGSLAYVSGVAVLAATAGTGEYRVSLPTGWTSATVADMRWEGGGRAIDVSTGAGYHITPVVGSASTLIGLNWVNGSGQYLSFTSNSPFGMVASDTMAWHLWLELDTG